MQKLLTFFIKNISVCAIFDDQSFNDTLTNGIVSFEQLGSDILYISAQNIDCRYSLEPPRRGGSKHRL